LFPHYPLFCFYRRFRICITNASGYAHTPYKISPIRTSPVSDVFLFGDREDGEEAEDGEQRRESPFPSREELSGEELGQRAENEAEYDQIGCGGIFLHRALDEAGRQKDAADGADDKGREGEKRGNVQRVDRGGQFFVNAENEEHLRNADAGQNKGDGNDNAAEKLDQNAGDHGERARAADLKNALGDQTDQKSADDTENGIREDGNADLLDFGGAEDHGGASRNGAEEEVARGNGCVCERERDQFCKEEKTDRGADQKFCQEEEAFLELALLENTVDGGDQSVVNTEDHRHGAARNAGNGHRASDPCAAGRGEEGVLYVLFFHHVCRVPFKKCVVFSDLSFIYYYIFRKITRGFF